MYAEKFIYLLLDRVVQSQNHMGAWLYDLSLKSLIR